MRKSLKTITAAALSAAMIFVPSMASFAEDINGAAASGSILAYDFDTVQVPTTIKFAINPQELSVTKSYTKVPASVAAPVAGTIYYTEADGVYTNAGKLTQFDSSKTYYTADTPVTDQIISLNYGIASKASADKNVLVSFTVAGGTANSGDELKDISFVDTAAKATAKSESNADGAEAGELKMYLELVPAAADGSVTTNTYAKATEWASAGVYYKRSDANVYSLATTDGTYATADLFKAETDQLYTATTAIGAEILPSELSDVTVSAFADAAAAKCGFEAGTNSSKSAIAFKLGKATYGLKAGQNIDFNTTQGDVAGKLDITTMGGYTGFTIKGAMNKNADWTKAKVKSLAITPVYTIKDSTGADAEAALTGGGLLQISTEAIEVTPVITEASVSSDTVVVGDSIDVSLPEGVTITGLEKAKRDGTYNELPAEYYTLEDISNGQKLTIASNLLEVYSTATSLKIVLSSGDPIEISVTAE